MVVHWKKGHHPRFWDIFGTDPERDARVFARVPIDECLSDAPDARARGASARVKVFGADARTPLDFELAHAEPEESNGRRLPHLQANATRAVFADDELTATFSITLEDAPRRARARQSSESVGSTTSVNQSLAMPRTTEANRSKSNGFTMQELQRSL